MKVLQLIYSLESGGAERFVVDLSNQLSAKHEVLICTIFDDAIPSKRFYINSLFKTVKFKSLKSKKGSSVKALFKFIYQVFKFKPDVIHIHLNTVNYAMVLAIFYRKCKFIQTIHNTAKEDVGTGVYKRIKKHFYKHKIIIPVTISPECKDSFVDYLKLENIIQINNGCCIPQKTTLYNDVVKEVDSYKVKSTDTVFIHIGRCHEQKNQQLLIDAFNKLNQKGFEFVLLIIGAGFNSNEGDKLKSNANERIHFLGEKTNVKDYLFCSNVFVLTSLWEGLPISLLESISCGNFSICTPAGGIPFVLKDDFIGFVSADFSTENFYKLLVRYFESKNSIDTSKIIDYFNENFSIENCTLEYEKIYND